MKSDLRKRFFLLLIFLLLSACKENLVRVKSETDANKILLSLRESGVDASKVFEATDWIIKVDNSQFTEALSILDRKRLYGRTMGAEKKSESDIFATHAQKSNEMLERISENLSESIMMIPGVIDARVHVYKEESDSILDVVNKQSASVVLVSEEENATNHDQIKVIVSKGAGVPLEFVAVIESFVKKQRKNEDVLVAPLLLQSSSNLEEAKLDWGMRFYNSISVKKLLLPFGMMIAFFASVFFIKKTFEFITKRKDISAITKILES